MRHHQLPPIGLAAASSFPLLSLQRMVLIYTGRSTSWPALGSRFLVSSRRWSWAVQFAGRSRHRGFPFQQIGGARNWMKISMSRSLHHRWKTWSIHIEASCQSGHRSSKSEKASIDNNTLIVAFNVTGKNFETGTSKLHMAQLMKQPGLRRMPVPVIFIHQTQTVFVRSTFCVLNVTSLVVTLTTSSPFAWSCLAQFSVVLAITSAGARLLFPTPERLGWENIAVNSCVVPCINLE